MSSNKSKPQYWRSLAELEDAPEFREFVEREFREPLQAEPPNSPARRRFMQLMGASFALAGASACRWKEDKLLPHSRRPEGHVPGMAQHYATAVEISGVATGLWAKSYDGRPIKIDGNPSDTTSLGATNAYHQASVLGLYDPDRSQGYVQFGGARKETTAAAFDDFVRQLATRLRAAQGTGLAVLAETSSSLALAAAKERLLAKFPRTLWVDYDPSISDNERLGTRLAFGEAQRVLLTPDRADVIVSLDSDFIAGTAPSGLAHARRVAGRRNPDQGRMNRIYAFESAFTEIGALADHRVAVRSGLIKALAAYLDAEITPKARPLPELGLAQPKPNAA
ncbi:MAG TPA: TAT-variant-translocated molybdopterin oxidoreductase, partial [Polyangiaceae bacterium]